METLREYFETGLNFHGHKCPAMPMGLRAGLAARKALGVERAQNKELYVKAEIADGHAMTCFLDGIMTATGCTYGKCNVEKLYYGKMAFTLIDTTSGRSVRVSVKPEFLQKGLNSPFVLERRKGVPPQDVDPAIVDPLVERVLSLPEEEFLNIGDIHHVDVPAKQGLFAAQPCARCGEMTFASKLRVTPEGELVCIPCSGYGS